jgi:hypothetical protein
LKLQIPGPGDTTGLSPAEVTFDGSTSTVSWQLGTMEPQGVILKLKVSNHPNLGVPNVDPYLFHSCFGGIIQIGLPCGVMLQKLLYFIFWDDVYTSDGFYLVN